MVVEHSIRQSAHHIVLCHHVRLVKLGYRLLGAKHPLIRCGLQEMSGLLMMSSIPSKARALHALVPRSG